MRGLGLATLRRAQSLGGNQLQIPHLQFHRSISVEFVDRRFDSEIENDSRLEFIEQRAGKTKSDAAHVRVALADVKLEMIAILSNAARFGGERQSAAAQ